MVQSGGKNVELAVMREKEPLKVLIKIYFDTCIIVQLHVFGILNVICD